MPTLTTLPDTVLDHPPRDCHGSGRPRKYDFAGWFHRLPDEDGKVRFVLVRGEDYHCTQNAMLIQLRCAASHHGLRASVVDLVDRVSVCVVPMPATRYVESPPDAVTVVVPFQRMTNVDRG